jgi:hypothetical protein
MAALPGLGRASLAQTAVAPLEGAAPDAAVGERRAPPGEVARQLPTRSAQPDEPAAVVGIVVRSAAGEVSGPGVPVWVWERAAPDAA